MTTAVAVDRIAEASPRFMARMAGTFYLLMAVAAGLAGFARRGLIVNGDAAATATNILTHESSFILSFAGEILVTASYLVVTALFYELFKPVSRSISLLAAFSSLAGCIIQAGACALN